MTDMSKQPRILDPNEHQPFADDGVTYCGWAGGDGIHHGCGRLWPCPMASSPGQDAAIEAAVRVLSEPRAYLSVEAFARDIIAAVYPVIAAALNHSAER